MRKAIKNSKAKLMYICNAMTQPGETDDFCVGDHVEVLNKYLDKRKIEVVIASNTDISQEMIDKYRREEEKSKVNIDYDNFDFYGGWDDGYSGPDDNCEFTPTIEWTCRGGADVYNVNDKMIDNPEYYQIVYEQYCRCAYPAPEAANDRAVPADAGQSVPPAGQNQNHQYAYIYLQSVKSQIITVYYITLACDMLLQNFPPTISFHFLS
jgi:hypothetical protein